MLASAADGVWYDSAGKVVRGHKVPEGAQQKVDEQPEWLQRQAPAGEAVSWEGKRQRRAGGERCPILPWYGGYGYSGVIFGYRDACQWHSRYGGGAHGHGRLKFQGKGWALELYR